ncbi:methylmalonyl-CoA mutase family protein [Calidifontibacillus erzurumensis]|uniref:Methylmalonyl-CoA mutase n=1 Tax=Calidifontibacillus erzurumensis TaxID=2741433 RepID=A0A8J8KAT7_9BACI|nr:methylmalonyl-CoA mutase family protein [Calidifontibacillus erzurumensis]NSL50408.1 methylmalonyl-CoA mutase [Calidifontibacillus erzurumensis]
MKTEKENKFNLDQFCEFPFPDEKKWQEVAEKSLKGKPIESIYTDTYEGIRLKPLYIRSDVEGLSHINDLPGEGSFVRGTNYLNNTHKPWDIAQEITARSAKAFNEAVREDLNRGQTMVHLVVDEATKRGMDPDKANEELVGANGIPVSTLEQLEEALANIDIAKYRLFMQTGISTMPLYASFVAYAKKQRINIQDVEAFIGLDPIGSIASFGKTQIGLKRLYHAMAQLAMYANQNTPNVKTIYVQGEVYHNAGASATEELAYVLATGVEYISEMLERGLDIDQIAKQMYFSFAVGSNVFMEIAKLRAARMLWSKIVKSFGGSKDAQKMYIHVRTSNQTKTIYDPYVNMLRATTEAFAGAVGGANSMHVSPFDEAIRPADTFSRRIARNTQIILQEESYLNQIVDPAGGSWYVESLTDAIAQKAWEIFQDIEKCGGMYEALKAGKVQAVISETAEKKKKNVETRKDRIVGTNMYPNLAEKPLEVREVIEDFKTDVINRIKNKKEQSNEGREKAIEAIRKAIANEEQLIPLFIDAASAGATIGEMISLLSENCKGAEITPLTAYRRSESFEKLRKAAEAYKEQKGEYPKVFFINLGSIPNHKARADFSEGFFAAGGFQAVRNDGYETAEEATKACEQSGIDTVVICGTDEQYEQFVPTIAKALKNSSKDRYIFVAGKLSSEVEKQFVSAGVDEFIHVKSNCYDVLARLQERKGLTI